MATNGRKGVMIHFRDPIPGNEPCGRLRHPNLTVTVEHCEALVASLSTEPEGGTVGPR